MYIQTCNIKIKRKNCIPPYQPIAQPSPTITQDVVVHVRDASHPDLRLQVASVHRTLSLMLSEEKMAGLIEVYNKTDLLTQQ